MYIIHNEDHADQVTWEVPKLAGETLKQNKERAEKDARRMTRTSGIKHYVR